MGIYNAWNLIQNAKKYEPNTTLSDSIKSKIGKLNGKKNTTHFRLAHSII